MVHWSGKGYLGLVIPFGVFSFAHLVVYLVEGDFQKFSNSTNTLIAGFVAIVLWLIGSDSTRISEATEIPEPWYKRKIKHSIFFLPLEWWGVLFFAIIAIKKFGT
jgi:hypothetical protein